MSLARPGGREPTASSPVDLDQTTHPHQHPDPLDHQNTHTHSTMVSALVLISLPCSPSLTLCLPHQSGQGITTGPSAACFISSPPLLHPRLTDHAPSLLPSHSPPTLLPLLPRHEHRASCLSCVFVGREEGKDAGGLASTRGGRVRLARRRP